MTRLSVARFWLIAAILACGGGAAHAQVVTGGVRVVTLKPLSIVNTRDLDFGMMLSPTSAGTVVINPNTDARTTTGGVTAFGGTPQAAQFYTYSTGNQYLQVSRGALPVLSRVGGGATMNVTNLTLNGAPMRYIGASGVLDLRVGGTLALAANQPEGSYTGSYAITVTYF